MQAEKLGGIGRENYGSLCEKYVGPRTGEIYTRSPYSIWPRDFTTRVDTRTRKERSRHEHIVALLGLRSSPVIYLLVRLEHQSLSRPVPRRDNRNGGAGREWIFQSPNREMEDLPEPSMLPTKQGASGQRWSLGPLRAIVFGR